MKAWEALLSSLEQQFGAETVKNWLRPIKVIRFDAANLYLEATPFQRSWFEEHISSRISDTFRNNNNRPIRIHWEIERSPSPSSSALNSIAWSIASDPLDPTYRIDSLIPFQPMALQFAEEISCFGKTNFNPLFLFGGTGSGKTHLLMSIASELLKKGVDAFYVRAESFTDHVVQAIRFGFVQDLRKRYRALDVLLIDDVDILSKKHATQEELFHTFNALHGLGKQIILSASIPPCQLEEIEARLVSRFEWGIAIPLKSPNRDETKKILEEKMKVWEFSLSDEILLFLLNRFQSSPKAPLDALHFLALRFGSDSKNLTLTQVERVLSEKLILEKKLKLTPEKIMQQTAHYFGIRVQDLTGKSQLRANVEPRKVAIFLCRNLLKMPFEKIGVLFNRDHSTIMSSTEGVEKAIVNKESPFSEAIERLSRTLKD
jgi:chromosomal replication initiator protein